MLSARYLRLEEESSARDARRRYTARSSGSATDRAAALRWAAAAWERGLRLVCSGDRGGRGTTFTANFPIVCPVTLRASASSADWYSRSLAAQTEELARKTSRPARMSASRHW